MDISSFGKISDLLTFLKPVSTSKLIAQGSGLFFLPMLAGDAKTAETSIQKMPTSKNQRPRHNKGKLKPVGYPNPAGKYQGQTGNKKQKDIEAPVVSKSPTEAADSQNDGRYYKDLLNAISGEKT
jgi:hypothetical protein